MGKIKREWSSLGKTDCFFDGWDSIKSVRLLSCHIYFIEHENMEVLTVKI